MKKELAFIFDLDGVIVDTAIYHYKAWQSIAKELGFDFTLEQNESLKGVSRMESLDRLLDFGAVSGLSNIEKIDLANRKNKLYREYILKLTPEAILPGVDSFLKKLVDQKFKIALGSASKNALTILSQIGYQDLFDSVIDGNKVSNSKPDPEVFLKAAEEVGVKPENSIVFEDAVAGITAAKSAKMRAIGVGDRKTLKEADLVIKSFENIEVSDCLNLL